MTGSGDEVVGETLPVFLLIFLEIFDNQRYIYKLEDKIGGYS